MSPRPPPALFDPIVERLPAGTLIHRVHEPGFADGTSNDGTVPNPGLGKPTRFAFFGEPLVPVLYGASTPEPAVHETVLHDAEPGMFLPRAHWRTKVLSVLRLERDLEVVSFHGAGLRRFGLYAADLTDTGVQAYPMTRHWAQAAWQHGADGVAYMCRHHNSSRAWCLFGDRLAPGTLRSVPEHEAVRAFAVPRDSDWLASIALAMRVVLRP